MSHRAPHEHRRISMGRIRALKRSRLTLAAVMAAGLVLALSLPSFGGDGTPRPHPIGHTEGFGNEKVLDFFYNQQFFCTDEWTDDLDGPAHEGDGQPSAVDPDEFQVPAMGPPGSPCIVGETDSGSLPMIDPTGDPVENSEPVWAIVPFFDADRDGIIDAVDPDPGVEVQCPEPGPPVTEHTGVFGTCTMHPSTLHAEPAGLGDIPLPNHSHIIDGDSFGSIWWQTIAVRVFNRRIWPDKDGRCPANPQGGEPCLISVDALRTAQRKGQAGPDTPSNVWLFFDSNTVPGVR
jgi:hypothetical protein